MKKSQNSLSVIRSLSKLVVILSHLRLASYDVTTPEGRSSERIRLLSWGTLTSGLSKVGSLLLVLASVRWGISYLGIERFGLWMTITSIITLLSFADFGLSNSLVNFVSSSAGKDDMDGLRRSVSNGLAIMILVSLLLGVIFYSIYFLIDWGVVTNVIEAKSINEAGPAIAAYFTIFIISLPLSVVQKVQIGLQESWRANLWAFSGQILALAGLVFVVYLDGGVPYLVLAVAGIPVVLTAINYVNFFYFKRRDICPRFSDVNSRMIKQLTHVSIWFLMMQLMAVIGNSSDIIIIGQTLGAGAVSPFAIMQKLTIILSFSQLFIAPMWPIFGEVMARGDHIWARRALTNALIVSILLGFLAALVIILFGADIITIWAGDLIRPNLSLLLGFAAFSILMSIGGSLSVFLNNGKYLRRQVLFYTIASVVSILLKVILVNYCQDASGAIWATVIGYSLFFIIPALLIAYSSKSDLI